MPQIFKVAGYLVYFWSNEGVPLEPIHVHIITGGHDYAEMGSRRLGV